MLDDTYVVITTEIDNKMSAFFVRVDMMKTEESVRGVRLRYNGTVFSVDDVEFDRPSPVVVHAISHTVSSICRSQNLQDIDSKRLFNEDYIILRHTETVVVGRVEG